MSCCMSSSRRTKRVYSTRYQTYIPRYLSSDSASPLLAGSVRSRAPACAPYGSPTARFPSKASLSSVHPRLYAAHPPAPVIGEVRFVILRRTAFPLRVSKPCAPRLTRVSPRPVRTGFASSSLSSLIAASRPMSRLHRMNREYHMSSPAHLRASRQGINPFWTAS